jgi:hypothetical protein
MFSYTLRRPISKASSAGTRGDHKAMNRRQLPCATRLGLRGRAVSYAAVLPVVSPDAKNQPKPLTLTDDEPRSSLGVQEVHVSRSRFPLIDIHTHISVSAKSKRDVKIAPERQHLGAPDELLAGMDLKNIGSMVNLTGGYGAGLTETIRRYDRAFSDRFLHSRSLPIPYS